MEPKPWIDVVGIDERGVAGLAPPARAALESAEIIIGGDRHPDLGPAIRAERLGWPEDLPATIELIRAQRGRRLVVLVTGDPLWFSVGYRIQRGIDPAEITYHPQLSAFQYAAARLGWSLADVETLTVQGRAVEQAIPFFAPGARLLILTQDASTPDRIAEFLVRDGYGPSRLTVLGALGGAQETRLEATAGTWTGPAPDFHLLAVECLVAEGARPLPPGPGLPDGAFEGPGAAFPPELRALALAHLAPRRGAVLWDIAAGRGAVAIEWLRLARDGSATALEADPEVRAAAARNALRLGAPRLRIEPGPPDAAHLARLPRPDAIHLDADRAPPGALAACIETAGPLCRLAAGAVTPEGIARLERALGAHGGRLLRLTLAVETPGAAPGPSLSAALWLDAR